MLWKESGLNYLSFQRVGNVLISGNINLILMVSAGAGGILRDHNGHMVMAFTSYLGECSNNYAGIQAIKWCLDNGFRNLIICLLFIWSTATYPPPGFSKMRSRRFKPWMQRVWFNLIFREGIQLPISWPILQSLKSTILSSQQLSTCLCRLYPLWRMKTKNRSKFSNNSEVKHLHLWSWLIFSFGYIVLYLVYLWALSQEFYLHLVYCLGRIVFELVRMHRLGSSPPLDHLLTYQYTPLVRLIHSYGLGDHCSEKFTSSRWSLNSFMDA